MNSARLAAVANFQRAPFQSALWTTLPFTGSDSVK